MQCSDFLVEEAIRVNSSEAGGPCAGPRWRRGGERAKGSALAAQYVMKDTELYS